MNEPERHGPLSPLVHDRWLRLAAVVAGLAVAALAAWLLFRSNGSESAAPEPATGSVVSLAALEARSEDAGHDVYWAGEQSRFRYELTETKGGNLFVRYLPPGVDANDPRPNFLTVGTYPRPDAYAILLAFSRQPGSTSRRLGDGAIAVYGRDKPNSVYIARRGRDVQVEVYDPAPGRALRLVTSGRVRPIR